MQLKFQVQTKIQKPIAEVFDAVYNPAKLSSYFTTGGASAPLDEGAKVMWHFADYPGDVPVTVKKMIPNQTIVLQWDAYEPKNPATKFLPSTTKPPSRSPSSRSAPTTPSSASPNPAGAKPREASTAPTATATAGPR